jgi:DNA-binding NtrC family response regulator
VEKRFLIITNEVKSGWIQTVKKTVALLGHIEIVTAKAAEAQMAQAHYELVFIDSAATKDIIPLISRLHSAHPKVPIMVATLTRGWHRAREALRAGAVDYILKSFSSEDLTSTIKGLLGYDVSTKPLVPESGAYFMPKATILFADNDPDFLDTRKEFLEHAGYRVITASNPIEARQKLEIGGIDLAILDIRLRDDDDDRDTSGLILAKKIAHEIPKVILTNFPTFDYVRDALRPQLDGSPVAIDFLSKVEGMTALLTTVEDTTLVQGVYCAWA